MWKKVFQYFLRRFQMTQGRSPMTAAEMNQIQSEAVDWINKTGGKTLPGIPQPQKPPFQGFTPRVIEGGKSKTPMAGIENINEKLTKALEERKKMFPGSKDKTLLRDSPEAIAKIKAENKAAAERLKAKKKTVEDFRDEGDFDPGGMASGGIARAKFGLGDLVKEKIPAEYRLYAKSILPGGESGKVGSDYFTGDFKQELRKQALDKYKRTGKLRGTVGEVDQHRGDPTINKLVGFPSTYASLGTYTYDINPKTLDVKITDRYDWNPAYGKQKIADTEVIGWIGDKKGKDVDLPMLKDFAVGAVKEGWSPSSALELIGNYFGGKASEGKGFDVDIDIPTRKATPATEGSFASGGIAGPLHLHDGGRAGFKKGGFDPSKRKFLKGTGAAVGLLSMLPFVGKFFKAAKPAIKTATPVAEVITRGADGIPNYVYDLINVVKAKGTKDIMEGFARGNPAQKKYTYKGVEVTEDGLGTTSVRKQHEGIGYDEAGEGFEGVNKEVGFEIKRGEDIVKKGGAGDDASKVVKAEDEYFEATVRPDAEGKMKDMEEFIDDVDHLDLKKIADEAFIKKAEGGLAHVLGV